MNPSPELNSILKQLRLSGILDSLEQRNCEAIDGQLAYVRAASTCVIPSRTACTTNFLKCACVDWSSFRASVFSFIPV
ncbi:hypothetical protein WK57_17635 [Burkholderia ubonensis]|uniref:Uncharacterized protein n=1 Tax=Burkholderia ubonensis TaxID=101571 RepID=A0A106IRD7_9BURK|nr:hypothetical protein WL16_05250 [Burkholderia ubonensis]KWA70071.1 hypothetical protein WL29_08315 [Burkholderia ubonensis]KWZ58339.1 hypothetical protein WK57_17635 [Burkholderia ubonensis]